MTELLPPYLSSALWFGAAACLILLLLVIFGYHLYQRSRFKAITTDGASVARLAARKEALQADVAELRDWLASHKAEQQKLEAERHKQELARVDLAQLEQQLVVKRNETQHMLARVAELDIVLEKRRQFHARLDAEIKSLEEQRQELAPMEKYAQDLRLELDQGRVRLAQIAQEEIRAQSLQTQAQVLRQELRELAQEIGPLREERAKLRQFIEQARQATAVKNEQLQDQKQQIRSLETRISTLELQKNSLESTAATARSQCDEIQARLNDLNQERLSLEKQAAECRLAAQSEQVQLEMLLQRREEHSSDVAALSARKALLERELELLREKIQPTTPVSEGDQTERNREKRRPVRLPSRGKFARPHI